MKKLCAKKSAALKKGDTIGVVAPAWSFDKANFMRGVEKLKDLGFKIRYDRRIFNKYWSMAGHDIERADQINRMFADKKVKAILCAKAGYGSMRTIPYLDKKIIIKNPKIFVGYSDITALLSYLYKVANMVVFHGPVIAGEIHGNMNPITLKYLLRAITQTKPMGRIKIHGLKALRPGGRSSGVLVGGNMSLIMSMIGTPYGIDTNEKILFLEDVGEGLETIDDYLMQLKMAGKFKKVKGIIFGRMVKCVDHSGKMYTIRNVLNDILGDLKIPILYGFPSGHRIPGDINVTLPIGVSATIDAADKCRLIINESGVS
ncbi:MAG: LD-carboxypeptidase [Candidatus Omnitrophica bacterium]|nr:LD-carboxypeptidase [Candidatus Omnitrophota bacterium]